MSKFLRTMGRPLFASLAAAVPQLAAGDPSGLEPHRANPILPGYFADPSIVQDGGKIYIYATLDPWGGETLGCWESSDFKDWTYRVLNWPTKQACTSPTSKTAMVWAPSVVKGPDGRFHMYVSVGSEVWAGVADHPLGPWANALGDQPMIPEDFRPGFHMIDAEAFIDDDGTPYLYWGSGWNWENGRCFAVKLKPDLVSFDGEVRDVTPANYFEAPFVSKRGGLYHLTYSNGKTTEDTYQVHCAVADSPFGPFTEIEASPILVTNRDRNILSPGHHALFTRGGRDYILYHRHSIPFDPEFVGRQICADELDYDDAGHMCKVTPTHDGPELTRGRDAGILPATASASSEADAMRSASRVTDDNFATRWAPAKDDKNPWLQVNLGAEKEVRRQEIRFEYAWKPYAFVLESTTDGTEWKTVMDTREQPTAGSPVTIDTPVRASLLRLRFFSPEPSVIEWRIAR